jgi:septal ring factor EnvC (AmiA/AmiB activator)
MTDAVNKLIEAAATAVADALLALDEAGAALKPAAAHRDVIARRIQALETERASILEARRSGHHDDATHGARLLLIAADIDELKAMLAEADAAVTPLRQATEETRRRVSAAIAARDTVREDEVLRLTVARANELGELLLQAAASIDSHKARLATSRNLWAPSKALADKLRALDLQRVQEVSKC